MVDNSPPSTPPNNNEYLNPLNNIIYGKKNQCIVSDTSDTLHQKLLRVEQCFRLNPNISRAFREYAKVKGGKLGFVVESALIEYMQNHPIPQIRLTISQEITDYQPELKNNLKLGMAKQELRHALNLLQDKDPRIIRENLPRLKKAINKALNCRSSDEELTVMLERAGGYLK